MKKKTQKNLSVLSTNFIKVPRLVAVGTLLLLLLTAFYSGYAWNQLRSLQKNSASATIFNAQKSQKPELKFFVMSFCPYGNQMEDALRPVFDLVGNKADLTPHYIFNKIENLGTYCKSNSGDTAQCSTYIQRGYFKTESECQKALTDSYNNCMDTNNYVKAQNGVMYSALHGRQEANQNIREICVWNQNSDKKLWWDFVGNVNKNCTADNADTCWQDQAKAAGLDTQKITDCFNNEGIALIEKELAQTNQYQISSSPTVMINGVLFPPESAYTQNGQGSLKIGNKIAPQARFRTPNVIKEALCTSFQKAPGECKTELPDLDGQAVPAGGC